MELVELLAAAGVGGAVGVGAAAFLAKSLVKNFLAKDLATHTANLNTAVNSAKAEVEAHLRQKVELTLGDAASERLYRGEAKRRLYQAVGPLKFQLMVAAAEWTNRVARFGAKDGSTYQMTAKGHFFRSTAYRMLRLLAAAELIERQIAYADFAVDPDMRVLLRFKRQLGQCLSSSDVSLGHSKEDWLNQTQHVFSDTLSNIAAAMVVVDEVQKVERVLRFEEFQAVLDDKAQTKSLHPIPELLTQFTAENKPLLWLRMLAMSQVCTALLELQGQELGLEVQPLDLGSLVAQTNDDEIMARKPDFLAALGKFRSALTHPDGSKDARSLGTQKNSSPQVQGKKQ